MQKAMIDAGYFLNQEEADSCLQFYEDLHGKGPAILKCAGDFEMLGVDVCISLDHGIYISIPEPSNEWYAESENSELMRIYR